MAANHIYVIDHRYVGHQIDVARPGIQGDATYDTEHRLLGHRRYVRFIIEPSVIIDMCVAIYMYCFMHVTVVRNECCGRRLCDHI